MHFAYFTRVSSCLTNNFKMQCYYMTTRTEKVVVDLGCDGSDSAGGGRLRGRFSRFSHHALLVERPKVHRAALWTDTSEVRRRDRRASQVDGLQMVLLWRGPRSRNDWSFGRSSWWRSAFFCWSSGRAVSDACVDHDGGSWDWDARGANSPSQPSERWAITSKQLYFTLHQTAQYDACGRANRSTFSTTPTPFFLLNWLSLLTLFHIPPTSTATTGPQAPQVPRSPPPPPSLILHYQRICQQKHSKPSVSVGNAVSMARSRGNKKVGLNGEQNSTSEEDSLIEFVFGEATVDAGEVLNISDCDAILWSRSRLRHFLVPYDGELGYHLWICTFREQTCENCSTRMVRSQIAQMLSICGKNPAYMCRGMKLLCRPYRTWRTNCARKITSTLEIVPCLERDYWRM